MIAKLLPPQIAHQAALKLIQMLPTSCEPLGEEVVINGLRFPSPVGLAAGFDKDCLVMAQAFGLGFGFVESGTLTPLPQPPNEGETVKRFFSQGAIFNRLGFPSEGAEKFIPRLETARRYRKNLAGIMGVNVGCNRSMAGSPQDYLKDCLTLAKLVGDKADYLAVNISSPNTKGLRKMQNPETITQLAAKIKRVSPLPLFVKLAPDIPKTPATKTLSPKNLAPKTIAPKDLAKAVLQSKFDGVILTNSSTELAPAFTNQPLAQLQGGISGKPLRDKSIQMVATFADVFRGKKPIIGCGGISNAEDVVLFAKAGAHLVQLYSAMVFEGLFVARKIVRELKNYPPIQSLNPYPLTPTN